MLFKEGESIDGVYIIIKGEFEYYKYIGKSWLEKTKSNYVKNSVMNKIPNPQKYKRTSLSLMQRGEVIGMEEIFEIFYDIKETLSYEIDKLIMKDKFPKTCDMRMEEA